MNKHWGTGMCVTLNPSKLNCTHPRNHEQPFSAYQLRPVCRTKSHWTELDVQCLWSLSIFRTISSGYMQKTRDIPSTYAAPPHPHKHDRNKQLNKRLNLYFLYLDLFCPNFLLAFPCTIVVRLMSMFNRTYTTPWEQIVRYQASLHPSNQTTPKDHDLLMSSSPWKWSFALVHLIGTSPI